MFNKIHYFINFAFSCCLISAAWLISIICIVSFIKKGNDVSFKYVFFSIIQLAFVIGYTIYMAKKYLLKNS
jgi:hypothetical protein